jgi:MinD superfamily P-loop ATPase
MIISIASGKGGTGKTTVATNLAVSVGKDVQLLDCDVEEPNARLFIRPEMDRKETISVPVPVIDEKKCTRCGQCSELCQFKAIAVIPDVAVLTFPELCHSCGGCWQVCPEGAVTQGKRQIGEIETGHRGPLEFVQGRLKIGEAMAPPLIKKTRSYTRVDKLTIIDAPPGTSCPVIASMRDSDFVLLVTEPTPFGLHDLKLAFEAAATLHIPAGLVINRMGLGDDKVFEYADSVGLPVLMKIPHDRRIAEAYSNGELIVDALPKFRQQFLQLYQRILAIVAENQDAERRGPKGPAVNITPKQEHSV